MMEVAQEGSLLPEFLYGLLARRGLMELLHCHVGTVIPREIYNSGRSGTDLGDEEGARKERRGGEGREGGGEGRGDRRKGTRNRDTARDK
jgi:hypothetical protein